MKSVYLRADQVHSGNHDLEGRRVGIAIESFWETNQIDPVRFLDTGAEFIGLSAAVSLGNGDYELAKKQCSFLGDSIGAHIDICEISGIEAPYRLWTEPGQHLADPLRKGLMREFLDECTAIADRLLPKGFPVEVSQNCLTNPKVTGAWINAMEILAERRPVIAGCQVWLTPLGGMSPGFLMGLMKTLERQGLGCTISEFGVVHTLPQSPHPSQDSLKLVDEWRETAITKWLLTTGLGPHEAPFWRPLDEYRYGPYRATPWASLALFDETIQRCYSRGAAAGGPAGVGTDFTTRSPTQLIATRKQRAGGG